MPTASFTIPSRFVQETTFSPLSTHNVCSPYPIYSTSPATLSSHTPFCSMLLLDKFDISSPRSHLSQGTLNFANIEQEVQRRRAALNIIRKGNIWAPNLAEALATVYVMLLEDDGHNLEQVIWAGLPDFIPIYMRARLLEGASHGWPLENELNTLVVSLHWLVSSRGKFGLIFLHGLALRSLSHR